MALAHRRAPVCARRRSTSTSSSRLPIAANRSSRVTADGGSPADVLSLMMPMSRLRNAALHLEQIGDGHGHDGKAAKAGAENDPARRGRRDCSLTGRRSRASCRRCRSHRTDASQRRLEVAPRRIGHQPEAEREERHPDDEAERPATSGAKEPDSPWRRPRTPSRPAEATTTSRLRDAERGPAAARHDDRFEHVAQRQRREDEADQEQQECRAPSRHNGKTAEPKCRGRSSLCLDFARSSL